jgi:hypothetical protein
MYNKLLSILALTICTAFTTGCDNDDPVDPNANFTLNISGLESLGTGFAYEGWLLVNGEPVSTGVFSVDGNGVLSKTSFTVAKDDLDAASTFVLTIEPNPDSDPAPTDVHLLAGDFNGTTAMLAVSHGAALNNAFTTVSGTFVLATPTDGPDTNENSGIWFLTLASGSPAVGLSLPTLPAGWIYEGWAVIDGTPVSTGTFTGLTGVDAADPYSGPMDGPPYPGEDFLVNAPSGLTFPTDLSGGMGVISIEPVPDNSAAPFLLKPLVGMIPANALDHSDYPMSQNLTFPTGTVTR